MSLATTRHVSHGRRAPIVTSHNQTTTEVHGRDHQDPAASQRNTGEPPAQEGTVRFYMGSAAGTFTVDPEVVARLFHAHPLGQRAAVETATGHPDALERLLARFLVAQGASWATPGQPDPYGTRAAFDTVWRCVSVRARETR